MDVKESYRVLELEIGASRAAVDAAYVRLIERWHPDRAASGGPDAIREAQHRVQAINDAYQTLVKIAPDSAAPSASLPTSTGPTAPAKLKLSPLPAGQPAAAGRLPPPPPPPPPETWAARSAPLPGDRPGQTPAGQLRQATAGTNPGPAAAGNGAAGTVPPAPPPTPTTPPPTASTPPALPVLRSIGEGGTKAEGPSAPPEEVPSLREKATALYDKLFPVDSPRRRFGPVIVAVALLFVLLLGKCTFSSLTHKSAGPPDPKTTGRLIVKSNVASATIEATRIQVHGRDAPVHVSGAVDQALSGLTPGSYAVTARVEGWPDLHEEVILTAARTTEVALNFKSGSLRLISDPAGATVRLGTTVLGKTPLVVPQLPPGECQLTLEYPWWPLTSFKTTITENVESTATVRLPHGKLTVETTPPGATVLLGRQSLGQTPLTLERFPAGTRKLGLQAKDFPPMEVSVAVEDRGDVKIHPALGAVFPVLDPAALLRAVWIPDSEDRIAPPLEGVTGAFQPRNGVVKNLNRKRLFETWLRKRYGYTATVKSYDPASGQIEFAEQPSEFSRYRVLAKLSTEARHEPDLTAQLSKGATFALYGYLSAVEEPRWPSKVITFEFSPAEPLR